MRIVPRPGRWIDAGGGLAGLARAMIAPVVTCVLVAVFWDRFSHVDLSLTLSAVSDIRPSQWLAACVFVAISYWSLGRFDAMSHRLLKTGVSQQRAGRAGMAAFAVSQTVGLGIITGALARWRLLPELGPGRALTVSTFGALCFMSAWIWAALGISTFGMLPPDTPRLLPLWTGVAFLAANGFILALAVWPYGFARDIRRFLRRRHIGLRALATMAMFAIVDMAAAAGALTMLMDNGVTITLWQLVPVFVIALGAGLLSSTPSGLGAFELTMLTLLPHVDPPLLMAAVAGYRLVYFSVPAMIGIVVLARPDMITSRWQSPASQWHQSEPLGTLPLAMEAELARAPLAEAHLARQPGLSLLWSGTDRCGGVIGTAGHSLVMIRDPLPATSAPIVIDALMRLAKDRGLTPCLYKCSARTAVAAKRRGFEVLRVAHEAWLRPASYDVKSRSRRQLRRKLRHAEQSGITFAEADPDRLPLDQMAAINSAWTEAHGGERGFSMGRFHPELIAHQKVFLAWQGQVLMGFVSFHTVEAEWTLDLLRPQPDALDGTSHGMIDCALQAAAAAGVPRLSLAAAPLDHSEPTDAGDAPLAKLQRRLAQRSGGAGLARFKSLFDPEWDPLYIAAPSRWKLLRAGAEIGRAIATPHPLPK